MKFRIKEFKPREVPDEFWEGYFEFIESNHREMNPDDPLPSREGIIQRQKADYPDYTVKRWLAYTPENKIIGWVGFGASKETASDHEENKHIAQINVRVLKNYRRKGLGTELLKTALKEAIALDRTTIETGTDHEAGAAFLKHYGAQLTIEGAENRLEMEDVDWDLMQSWIDEGAKRAPGVTIEEFDNICPEVIIDEYVEMFTEALNMQPLGETEGRANIDAEAWRKNEQRRGETGQKNYAMYTKEPDGRISGLTDIYFDPRDGDRIHQGLTGVRPKFRGKGLGKWLKAKMIFHIKENYPDVQRILTGNAETNEAMLSINKRMGFKRYKGEDGYKFKTEELAKKLGL